MVPSDPKVMSHPVSKLHKGRGRFWDPAPSSSDDQDAGIGGSAQGAPRRNGSKSPQQQWSKIWDILPPSPVPGPRDTRGVDRDKPGNSFT
jgi:hypothetical protein